MSLPDTLQILVGSGLLGVQGTCDMFYSVHLGGWHLPVETSKSTMLANLVLILGEGIAVQ